MSIKFRLTAMQFLQFFVWGAWLISLGGYMGGTLHFEGGQIGAIFATMGIASLIMPGLTGIIADKWINAERLYGILHLIGEVHSPHGTDKAYRSPYTDGGEVFHQIHFISFQRIVGYGVGQR